MKASSALRLPRSPLAAGAAALLAIATCNPAVAQHAGPRLFQPEDMNAIKDVGDIAMSPDGEWVAYAVATVDTEKDRSVSDLFMVRFDGTDRIQLTYTKEDSENHPRFSPDGKYLAFIAARGRGDAGDEDDPAGKAQVWLLNRAGGEAERLTEMAGGVSDFEWSPEGTRLVLVSMDPEKKKGNDAAGADSNGSKKKNDTSAPIVIDRYQFKQDVQGYLVDRYQRLYLFDVAARKATLLTDGDYNSVEPAWSPGGDGIAFSSKRDGDPDRNENSDIYLIDSAAGATARKLTSWPGPDNSPVFSPDGRRIAYLQGGEPKYADYDPAQLAVIPADGGEVSLPTAALDRDMRSPRWSRDGKTLYFLVVDDRVRSLRRVSASGGKVRRAYPAANTPGVVRSFAVGKKGLVTVTTFGQRPAEIYRGTDGRALSEHNHKLVDAIRWASVEGYDSVDNDGLRVGSMLLKPPGFHKGVAYPTIVYVHGGPVSQDGYEFDTVSQVLAAQGYLVVNPNYRGSSGRGRAYSRVIYADWGHLEIRDIHTVVDHLVEEGLADPKRLGIGGWSYGGMSTNYAIATDHRFAAAVSGASIANMITGYGTDQYIRQYENEIGLPWQSIDTYLKISYPFFHADRIRTPTLFMVGEKDFNVPLINSEQMYQALRSLNVPTELVIYPGQFHGLTTPSYIEDRLQRMIDWYGKYLGAG